MVLKAICLVRHGSRERYGDAKVADRKKFDDPSGSRGLNSLDDQLTAIGRQQAQELANYLSSAHPEISAVYTSRHYRCLETVKPYVEKCEREGNDVKFRLEMGLSEWGRADRQQARMPSIKQFKEYHSTLDAKRQSLCSPLGHENLDEFYARNACFLASLIQSLDNEPNGPESVLLCTSASNVTWIARILLGKFPENSVEQDFSVPAIGFYRFARRNVLPVDIDLGRRTPLGYPEIDWKNGVSIGGSWEVTHSADCSFLSTGSIMLWTPSDIPKYLPPCEALQMPKPSLPNFFDIQDLNAGESDLRMECADFEREGVITATAVEVPA
ncbi:hypothetical protein TWF481_006650 [Arthrobotrys musiformis]|uniref:Phosphoglycerate mutase-like protein n=1 Tax=Arthrobotrys musiformis TaxID=47236 RepID=A0AAV9WB22_9PEZI